MPDAEYWSHPGPWCQYQFEMAGMIHTCDISIGHEGSHQCRLHKLVFSGEAKP